jgi:photosystem II cytochrome c550
MLRKLTTFIVCLFIILGLTLEWSVPPALAIDAYVARYLQAREPINLAMDPQGTVKEFSPGALGEGKKLFEQHCLNCHVGGATLPDPRVSLSLKTLQGATPPRDTINSLVAFLREPMTYDGTEPSYWCRQVPETWMSQPEIEGLAAFVLRAAQKAPGWGTDKFDL